MVTKKNLKDYAAKLMFDMDEEGYDRTLKEFETVEKHMALIGEIEGIENVEPTTARAISNPARTNFFVFFILENLFLYNF